MCFYRMAASRYAIPLLSSQPSSRLIDEAELFLKWQDYFCTQDKTQQRICLQSCSKQVAYCVA